MNVILKPIVTEKSSKLTEQGNCYTFQVEGRLNKIEIKKAIELKYKVEVRRVNTLNTRIERKLKNTKKGPRLTQKKAVKKAIVYLSQGQSLDFYTN